MRAIAALTGLWCIAALTAVRLDAQRAPPPQHTDSSFLLATGDPARLPSPFIGNGRLGTVIPPLGIRRGAVVSGRALRARSGRRAAYRRDSGLDRDRGVRWRTGGLDGKTQSDGSTSGYQQTWTCGPPPPAPATNGATEPGARRSGWRCLSRGPTPPGGRPARTHPPAARPDARSLRAGRLAASPAAPTRHSQADGAGLGAGGGLVSGTHGRQLPQGRPGAGRGQPVADLDSRGAYQHPGPSPHPSPGGTTCPGERPHHGGGRYGDGRDLLRCLTGPELCLRRAGEHGARPRERRIRWRRQRGRRRPARSRGYHSLADANARAWRPAVGKRHRDRRRPRAPAGGPLDALSTCSAAPTPERRSASRRWASRAAAITGTSSGTPIPGCSRRFCSPILTSPTLSSPFAPGPWRPPARTRAPTASAAPCTRGRRTSWGTRRRPTRRAERPLRDPRHRGRRAGTMAVLSRHRRLRVARPGRIPRDPRHRGFSG